MPEANEEVLKGGRANTGAVVRINDEVARPNYPQSDCVDDFLGHLERSGLHVVPIPLGLDDQGRRRFSYIEGQAPTPPYPDWAFDERLLIEVATAQRQLHVAAMTYTEPADSVWAVSAGDYFPPAATTADAVDMVVCHNDLGMSNVIVDEHHRLTGIIDFDYCRPVDPLFDIAVAARHWAPFGDLDIDNGPELDRVRRFGLYCDVHELDSGQRRRVVDLSIAFLEQARGNVKALAAAGGVGFQALLRAGYEETNIATVEWLQMQTDRLAST